MGTLSSRFRLQRHHFCLLPASQLGPSSTRLRGRSPLYIEQPSPRDILTLRTICEQWRTPAFQNPSLLLRALTPPAYSHPCEQHRGLRPGSLSNRRLEFLGDKVVQASVALAMRKQKGVDYSLSESTKECVSVGERVGAAVENAALEQQARSMGLDKIVRGTVGDRAGRILSDAFEAVCGALYIEGGLEKVEPIVQGLAIAKRVDWTRELERELGLWAECKGMRIARIGEQVQRRPGHMQVAIRIVDVQGLDTHMATFSCQVDATIYRSTGTGRVAWSIFCLGRARRKNKCEAQQAAAEAAVRALRGEHSAQSDDILKFLQEARWANAKTCTTLNSSIIRKLRQLKIYRRNENIAAKEFSNAIEDSELDLSSSNIRMKRLFQHLWGNKLTSFDAFGSSITQAVEMTQKESLAWRRFTGICLRKLWAAEQGFLAGGSMTLANTVYVDYIQRRLISGKALESFKGLVNSHDKTIRRGVLEIELIGWLWETNGWSWTRHFLRRVLDTREENPCDLATAS